ncbi:MAG: hypothetical protein LBI68_09200, partial [Azoarcus sp.]|nr:hypothetical protein [Azoarcus sp.]
IVESISAPDDKKLDEFYRRAIARIPKEDREDKTRRIQELGWQDRRVVINPKELYKIANKPEFLAGGATNADVANQIARIVNDLGRPAAMFWDAKNNSAHIIRREKMKGDTAIVAISPEAASQERKGGRTEKVHLVVTVHAKQEHEVTERIASHGESKAGNGYRCMLTREQHQTH